MPSADPDPRREVFHSRFNRVLAVVVWAIVALLLASGVVSGILAARPVFLVPAALLALAGWVALWRPAVIVDDEAAKLVNVARTVTVPWPALIDVDTKYALTLRTPGHVYPAWAAPAPGRAGAAMARRRERGSVRPPGPLPSERSRPGDLLASESGQAAYMVRARWQELVGAGRVEAGIADRVRVVQTWHLGYLGPLIALAIGSVFALGWV